MIKDSGERTEYETGAVRDCKEGKGRCDLLPLGIVADIMNSEPLYRISAFKNTGDVMFLYKAIQEFAKSKNWGSAAGNDLLMLESERIPEMLLDVSKHFEEGAKKYGENNWQKGIPIHSYIDSAVRHYLKFRAGWIDEPHDRAFVWNLMCCIWTMGYHPEMDDYTEEAQHENH